MQNPRVVRELSYISQFDCSSIEHIKGAENNVADDLSRTVFSISSVDYEEITAAEKADEELANVRNSEMSLDLRRQALVDSPRELWCNISTPVARPFIPQQFKEQLFNKVHNARRPGVKATQRIMSRRMV